MFASKPNRSDLNGFEYYSFCIVPCFYVEGTCLYNADDGGIVSRNEQGSDADEFEGIDAGGGFQREL